MIKKYLAFYLIGMILGGGCQELNSPDQYLSIPGKIQIKEVTYNSNSKKFIVNFIWDEYKSKISGYRMERNSIVVAQVAKESTSYSDIIPQSGTYEYNLYALDGNKSSIPSYIKIDLTPTKYSYSYN